MIKFNELRVGDFVIANNDGDRKPGEVVELKPANKQVRVDDGVQAFWYEIDQIFSIPLGEDSLKRLQFHKLPNGDGTIKYMKGAFRMMIPKEGDFSRMELWYRDEQRHVMHPINVHELQNHFLEMTKVHLNEGSFD